MFKRLANQLLSNVGDVVAREAVKALTPHVQDAVSGVVEAVMDNAPSIRSTGGGTSVYLTKVKSDFKDFHAEDADNAIQTAVIEFIQLQYGVIDGFDKANVSKEFTVVGDIKKASLSNMKINSMSIGDYQKSLNSATIKYRVSIGFDVNGARQEKLYEMEYTLQLRDEYGEQKFLECQNCGAPLEEASGECKYCGMKHLRDTIESWVVTNIKEK